VQSRREADLARAFGDSLGPHLFILANGLDPRVVEPERAAKSIGHELTFAEDLRREDAVAGTLLQLAEMVGRRLRRHGLRSEVVRLKLRYGDFTTLVRQRKVAATADDLDLYRTARDLLFTNWDRRRPVRLLGVTAAQLVTGGEPAQGSLFAPAPQKRDRLLQAMDKVRDRHGEDALRHGGERRGTNPWGPDRE
jgi:DNA polymerase IV